ncbi:MAG TPA: PAS domain S-box protein, partial [Anaerolineales bacterium]|nr:PAS domain S-box protein [Anaerolineales bacterium]
MTTAPQKWTLYDGIKGEDEKRLAQILWVIIEIFWVGSGVLIFLDLLWGDKTLWGLLMAGCFFQLVPTYLLFRGKLEASSFTTVGIYIFFATASATIGQGIRDYVLVVYPSIILFSGLTVKRRGMVAATALTLLALAWLTFGDIYGLYTPHKPNPAILFDFIILGILIIISSAGVHLLVENLEYTHKKTKTELNERKKTETLLYESEKSFKEIFENSPDNIFVFDVCPDGRFRVRKINSALEKVFNTERVNIEGKYLDEIVDPKSVEGISNNFRRCIETKAQTQYDEFANLPNKSYSTHLTPIMDESGTVTRLIGISRDITQLKQTEAQLRDSETRFRLLFETMIQGVILYSANGEIISANPAAELLLGLSLEQMQERTLMDSRWKVIHENGEEVQGNEHPAMVALQTGQDVRNAIIGVFNLQAEDYRWINVNAVPQFKNGEQKPYQVYTTFDDITERKKIAETLKSSEMRYRLLAENISDVIWIYDVIENRTRYISPSVERLRGYTPEEIVAGTMESALTPASFQYVQKSIAARLRDFQNGQREFYVDELEQIRKDGSTVWTEVTANFQVNPENGHIEIYGVSRDISEKRQAREALLASEERIRQLVDSAPYSIFGIHQDGTINFANTEASKLLGYSHQELVGKNVDELLPTRFRGFHATHRLVYSERPYIRQLGTGTDLLAQHKDGSEIPVDLKLSYYRFEGSLHIIVFMQNISERKKAEELLRESEARFRLLFETMVQGVVFQSRSGEIVLANPAAEGLLGLTRDQMQGRSSLDPRWRTIHEDGSELPGQEHPAMIALRTGEEVRNVVLGVYNPQINDYRWINVNSVPQFKDGEREPYQVYTTFEDMTDRKQSNEALKASETRYR